MNSGYDECQRKGKITPFTRGRTLAPKELDSASFDLARARKTLQDSDFKWATIQLYYSMFHSARALLYSLNLREHSHHCLMEAIRHLFVKTHQVPAELLENFKEAKILREDADYYSRWSKSGCERLLRSAGELLAKAREIASQAQDAP